MNKFYSILEQYNKIKSNADKESIDCFIEKINNEINKLECKDYKFYIDILSDLHESTNGPHFDYELVEKALCNIKEFDSSFEIKWCKAETDAVASKYMIVFDKFTPCDWYYSMNVVYNSFKNIHRSDLREKCKLTFEWINDPLCKEGKAYYHYKNWAKYHKEG